jgi:hypothetical protein
MKPLIIKGTEYSPQVTFNPDASLFQISGESRPEDAGKLFGSVLKWLEEYLSEIKKGNSNSLKFEFDLLYFNTVSAKYILEIMRLLHQSNSEGVNIRIVWHYKEKDEDIKESGEEFARLVALPFEFVSKK